MPTSFQPLSAVVSEARRPKPPVETLLVSTGTCFLGTVLVASSRVGLCAVLPGEDVPSVINALQRCFPAAVCLPGNAGHQAYLAQVLDYLDSPHEPWALPLDVRGTLFQQRVWQALRTVPAGATVSYAALARQAGVPQAVRAVASACAANVLAVVIPCHRVIGSKGDLCGYRWGLGRKQVLLQRESALAGTYGQAVFTR